MTISTSLEHKQRT